MMIKIDKRKMGDTTVAIIKSDELTIVDAQQAMDIAWSCDCEKIIFPKHVFSDDFFDLKTGIAGEILQKFATYRFTIAIVGDFSKYHSTSLHDFIYESNKGRQVFFLPDEDTALQKMQCM